MAWQFWVDRGGTFTDVVALSPQGNVFTHKVLSFGKEPLFDPILQGIETLMGVPFSQSMKASAIESCVFGTTLVTNGLLEDLGDSVAFLTTCGFKDSLKIAYQDRPSLFDLNIKPYRVLYDESFEITERIDSNGKILCPIDLKEARNTLHKIHKQGYRSLAICLMNSYQNPIHEEELKKIAEELSFDHISVSYELSLKSRFIPRGSTTVLNAKTTPSLQRYIHEMTNALNSIPIELMQSNGGVVKSGHAQGMDMVLSGPAGGVIGAKKIAEEERIAKIISFDMGGTSTDISVLNRKEDIIYEKEISGTLIQTPMVDIKTIASGGGSVVSLKGSRLSVGPKSAGAYPGPASYRNGGPLTLTDCQVALGRIIPKYFPKVFGEEANLSLDMEPVRRELEELSQEIFSVSNKRLNAVQIAEGAIQISVEKMAHAIRQAFIDKGGPIEEYALMGFGSAAGQYICRVADALEIKKICIPKIAGVLSAFGIGHAPIKKIKIVSFDALLLNSSTSDWDDKWKTLASGLITELELSGKENLKIKNYIHLKYKGTLDSMSIAFDQEQKITQNFEIAFKERYGFLLKREDIQIDALSTEVSYERLKKNINEYEYPQCSDEEEDPIVDEIPMCIQGMWKNIPVYSLRSLKQESLIDGPAVLVGDQQTIIVDTGWQLGMSLNRNMILKKTKREALINSPYEWSPIQLERFHVLFRAIAKQMGVVLKNTAHSVNIKERQDFSCALFDMKGRLIANAPHVPVHLGSMGDSVKEVISNFKNRMLDGDAFMINSPYKGGTHLPDITVVMPVFYAGLPHPFAYVAARGHHADVGGISPGSMSARSKLISEEGVLIDATLILKDEVFLEDAIRELFQKQPLSCRNIEQNLADLLAQIAACQEGKKQLIHSAKFYGGGVIQQYMEYILVNAKKEIEALIPFMKESHFSLDMDLDHHIAVHLTPLKKENRLRIDFKGSSPQTKDNFNAPFSVCKAAVLYVLRSLIPRDIPLNEGCLWPIEINVPKGSFLSPEKPAAVAAGNVETSQAITNALLGALEALAASQGTMNNVCVGNDRFQYYETICGGCGAGPTFNGASAIHSHMTNSRLTDPEILEKLFPIRLHSFVIRLNSGGLGLYNGGNGVIRKLVFLENMELNILSNNREHAPFGIKGGASGKKGNQYLHKKGGEKKHLSSCCYEKVFKGDMLIIETPGGGAYGKKTGGLL